MMNEAGSRFSRGDVVAGGAPRGGLLSLSLVPDHADRLVNMEASRLCRLGNFYRRCREREQGAERKKLSE